MNRCSQLLRDGEENLVGFIDEPGDLMDDVINLDNDEDDIDNILNIVSSREHQGDDDDIQRALNAAKMSDDGDDIDQMEEKRGTIPNTRMPDDDDLSFGSEHTLILSKNASSPRTNDNENPSDMELETIEMESTGRNNNMAPDPANSEDVIPATPESNENVSRSI